MGATLFCLWSEIQPIKENLWLLKLATSKLTRSLPKGFQKQALLHI